MALSVINDAYGEGRLNAVEYDQRLHAALQARTLGDLTPLVSDVVTTVSDPQPSRVRRVRDTTLRAWLGLALLFNVIWLATWVFSGIGPYYYWPIWPMIGTAIPALIPFFFPDRAKGASDRPVLPPQPGGPTYRG